LSINLERDLIQYGVKVAIRKHLSTWQSSDDLAERLSAVMTEVMFDVAGTAASEGPEEGICEGLAMLRNWED